MIGTILAAISSFAIWEKAIAAVVALLLVCLGVYLAHLYARSFTGFLVTQAVVLAVGFVAGAYIAKRGLAL